MYQNGYTHGSPSRFSAKLAIYTAAGCQHKIAIYTTAVPEPIQIYTREGLDSKKIIFKERCGKMRKEHKRGKRWEKRLLGTGKVQMI